jgi:V/A-type H+-transporting ATPase subunit E
MNGIEKLIRHIRSEADEKCAEIANNAAEQCTHIRAEYARIEQEAYWKCIDAGTKETELRMERLRSLAEVEANKQILAMQDEMVSEAFALAAKKLRELPSDEYAAILKRLGMGAGSSVSDVIENYRSVLSPEVTSVLFS